jgi:hypothetical protein
MSIKKTISAVAGVSLVLSFAFALTVSAASFSRNLTVGSKGADVKDLQVFLNANGYVVALSGTGSAGKESTKFGPATKAALVKYQTAKGIKPASGFFGELTRASVNAKSSAMTTPTSPSSMTPSTPTPAVAVGTGLSVSSPVQPMNSVAPASAARVPFTKVTLTAGTDGDVTVNSLTVARTGLANDAAFSGIVLLDENGTQIGIAKTLNSNHQTTVGEPIVVKKGTSRTLTIGGNMTDAATMVSYAGQVATLTVVGVNTSATVSGSLPVTGAAHTMNATSLIGSVSMQRGAIDPGASQTKEVGTTNYVFSSVKVTAGSAEPVLLSSVRWNQTGSIGVNDLANLKTWVDGVSYPVMVSTDGQYYTTVFPGNGISIDKGFSKDISISGDIIGGSSRTIDFDIAKRTDIAVTGALFGYGIIPPQTGSVAYSQSSNASQFSSSEDPWYSASEVTVNTGVVTVSSDTAVSAQNIAVNLQNQPLAGFKVEVRGEPVTVAKMVFNVTAVGDQVSHITNVSLVDQNGSVIAGPVDGSGAAQNGTLTFTDTVTFPVGTTNFSLKGKLSTDFVSNDTVQASTTPATQWTTVTGVTTGKSVTPAPASAISGNTMTVKAGALAISVSSQPTARYVIAGANGFEFARYVLDAGQSGEDLRVTSLPLRLTYATISASNLTSCQLFNGATAVTTGSNLKNPSVASGSDETFTFDGTGLIVPKGTAKTVSLKCNLSTSAASGSVSWGIASIALTSSISGVTSGQTITVNPTPSTGNTMTASTGGSYTVTSDTSSAYYYRAIKAGSTNVPLAAFKFTAGNSEDIWLKKVALVLGNTASSAPADLVGQKVTLWYNGSQVGEAQFGGASADNATSTLTSAVQVARGETATIVVKGDVISHDSNTNATSNPNNGGYGAFLAVNYDGNNNGLNGNYATGADSGSNISGAAVSGNVTTNGVRIFRNVPTFSIVSNGGTLVAGSDLYKFTVTNPDPSRDLVLKQVTFSIATTGSMVTGFQLFGDGIAANATPVNCNSNCYYSTGSTTIAFDATSNAKIVPAGGSKTYALRANTVTAIATAPATDYLNISLLADRTGTNVGNTTGGTLMGTAAQVAAAQGGNASTAASNIIWSPFSTTTASADAVTESNLDWTNGYGLPGFPAPGQDFAVQSFSRSR